MCPPHAFVGQLLRDIALELGEQGLRRRPGCGLGPVLLLGEKGVKLRAQCLDSDLNHAIPQGGPKRLLGVDGATKLGNLFLDGRQGHLVIDIP